MTTTWTPAQTELLRRIEEIAPPKGWRVVRRDDGFDMDRDLTRETRDVETNARPERTRWRNLAHEVRFEADGSYVVTDVDRRRSVDRRGTDRGEYATVERGRKIGGGGSVSFKLVGGRLKRIDDNRYDLSEGRTLVEREAKAAGITQYRAKLGWEAKIGLGFAILAIGGLIVGGIVIGILALTGTMPQG